MPYPETVATLLEAGANPNYVFWMPDDTAFEQQSPVFPLALALSYGNSLVVDVLLSAGAGTCLIYFIFNVIRSQHFGGIAAA
jgi:ankyrin repeat protein